MDYINANVVGWSEQGYSRRWRGSDLVLQDSCQSTSRCILALVCVDVILTPQEEQEQDSQEPEQLQLEQVLFRSRQ